MKGLHGSLCHSSAPSHWWLPRDKQSGEQCVHVRTVRTDDSSRKRESLLSATAILLWNTEQTRHMQIKSLAQQFTLFNTLSVFDSVPLSSFFSLFEDPVFSKSTAKSLGNNPSIFSPKLCSANPHFSYQIFIAWARRKQIKIRAVTVSLEWKQGKYFHPFVFFTNCL